MLLDFEVERSSRRCAATDRTLEPGDEVYAVLQRRGAEIVRTDFCREAWSGPPEEAFGWWRWRVPPATTRKIKLAPNDVLLELFDQLADKPGHEDERYVLALLLIRRRVFRLEMSLEPAQPTSAAPTHEMMHVFCTKRDTNYEVPVAMPTDERIDQIQHQLSELLIAGAE